MKLNPDLSNFTDVFKSPTSGLFLSFEGVEGSGKSTQIEKLENHFQSLSRPTLRLREPGGTQFGEKLRAAILNQDHPLDSLSETFVFLASRAQLLREKILPFLADPKAVVLLDRYVDSTLVYQALSQNKELSQIWTLHQFGPLNILPHQTFLLDIPVEVSLARQELRGQNRDYFESRHKSFQESLVNGYRQLAKTYPNRITKIDATGDIDTVYRALMKALNEQGHLS